MTGIIPRGIPYTAETKECHEPDHRHKDPHVDILYFELGGHSVVVESERWSLVYNVHVDDTLKGQELTPAEVNAFIEGMQP